MHNPSSEDLSGKTLLGGGLRLLEWLGAGAYGAVYRAQQYALGRPLRKVAVKLTHQGGLTPEEAHERLGDGFVLARVIAGCREAEARKHLIHVFDVGVADDLGGRGYLVMECVSGVLLLQHIRAFGERIPQATARRYFREMGVAVAACHAAGVLHSDLKPDNVLIDQCHTVRLVDFGWARTFSRAGYVAGPGGCLPYSAPEVLLGRGLPASDVYSLGLIMYEALTGGGPHLDIPAPPPGPSTHHYYRHKQQLTFRPLAECNRSVPADPELFRIVERCYRFYAEERYASVGDLLDDLDRSAPTPAGPILSRAPTPPPSELDGDERRQILDRYLDAGDYRRCLELLDGGGPEGPAREAYQVICHAEVGEWEEALRVGVDLYERLRGAETFPDPLRRRLRAALTRAAAAGGPTYQHLVDYYHSEGGH